MKIGWKLIAVVLALAVVGTWLTLDPKRGERVKAVWRMVAGESHGDELRPDKTWIKPTSLEKTPINVITIGREQVDAIGLKTETVKAQSEPVILRLPGVTDYDPATLTIVRSPFNSRVDRVLVDLGSLVKIGDPLLELFSTELAEAKSDYEMTRSQWTRDKRVLDYKAPLAQSETLPRKELIEIENDEAKSRLQMKLAADKLLVYGLTEKEIEEAQSEDGVRKARMTLRSRADGIVVKRSVVPGNYYDAKDEMMEIAPLDHLWVRGSVSELDADKVQVGQPIRVIFPYSHQSINDEVEYIDKAIDPETRSAKFRASIPNPDRRLKAGMFVRVLLEIPPQQGQTIIPRSSMVSVDRLDYVFVLQPDSSSSGPLKFERRNILASSESSDWVVVAEPSKEYPGLKPGEQVATNGSLILEQMYEDRLIIEGEQPQDRPLDDEAFGKPETSISIIAP